MMTELTNDQLARLLGDVLAADPRDSLIFCTCGKLRAPYSRCTNRYCTTNTRPIIPHDYVGDN